jgi:hypothetical protein
VNRQGAPKVPRPRGVRVIFWLRRSRRVDGREIMPSAVYPVVPKIAKSVRSTRCLAFPRSYRTFANATNP